MNKKILSSLLISLLMLTGIATSFAADDSTTTVIEGTNINITNSNGTSGSSSGSTSSSSSNTNSTSTVDNSVTISAGATDAFSNFTSGLMTSNTKYDAGDINGDGVPDIIVYRTSNIIEIWEFSKVGMTYVLSQTIDSTYIKNQLIALGVIEPYKWYVRTKTVPKDGHYEGYLDTVNSEIISVDGNVTFTADKSNQFVYFIKDVNGKNRAIFNLKVSLGFGTQSSGGCNSFLTFKGENYTTTGCNRNMSRITYTNNQAVTSDVSIGNSIRKIYEVTLQSTENVKKLGLTPKGYTSVFNSNWYNGYDGTNRFYNWTNTKNGTTYLTGSTVIPFTTPSALDTTTDINADKIPDLTLYGDFSRNPNDRISSYVYSSSEDKYIEQGVSTTSSDKSIGVDINNDFKEDAVFYTDSDDTGLYKNLQIYVNNNGNYVQALNVTNISGVIYQDFDNDDNSTLNGAKDIITYIKNNDGTYKYQVFVYNPATLAYVNVLQPISFLNGLAFSLSDVNGDGNTDISFTKNDGNTYVYKYVSKAESSMIPYTNIDGNDYKYLNLNGDLYKDLVTRKYLGIFGGKNFYTYKVFFFNTSTGVFDEKTSNIKLISAKINFWETLDDTTLEDYNGDGYKDLIAEGSAAKSVYYFGGTDNQYYFLDNIKIDSDNSKYVYSDKTGNALNEKDILVIGPAGYLNRYSYNSTSKLYEKNTDYYDGETKKTDGFTYFVGTGSNVGSTVNTFLDTPNFKIIGTGVNKILLAKDSSGKLVIMKKSGYLGDSANILTKQVSNLAVNDSKIKFGNLSSLSSSTTNSFLTSPYNSNDGYLLAIGDLGVYMSSATPSKVGKYLDSGYSTEDVYFSDNVQYKIGSDYIPLIANTSSVTQEDKTIASMVRYKILNNYAIPKIKTVGYLSGAVAKNITNNSAWRGSRGYVCNANAQSYGYRVYGVLNGSSKMGITGVSGTETCVTPRSNGASYGGPSDYDLVCGNSRGSICSYATGSQTVTMTEYTYNIRNLLGTNKIDINRVFYGSSQSDRLGGIDSSQNIVTDKYDYGYWGLTNTPAENLTIKKENATGSLIITSIDPIYTSNYGRAINASTCDFVNDPYGGRERLNVYYKIGGNGKRYCTTTLPYTFPNVPTPKFRIYKNTTLLEDIGLDTTVSKAGNIQPVNEAASTEFAALGNGTTYNNAIFERTVANQNITVPANCPSQMVGKTPYGSSSSADYVLQGRNGNRFNFCLQNIQGYNVSYSRNQYNTTFSAPILRQSLTKN